MTPDEKDLLLKDLCSRLNTNLVCSIYREDDYGIGYRDEFLHGYYKVDDGYEFYFGEDCGISVDNISKIKPYLFPLSSMTEEQKREFYKFFEEGITESANETRQWLRTKRADETRRPVTIAYVMVHELVIDWLNKNHFDYRGLIPMGLAIDATNLHIY